jgi:tRNA pseudouridine38-40 synthase
VKALSTRNVKLEIEYDGTNFSGWQRQPAVRTVEGEIAGVLRELTGAEPELIVAGRTDSGVHALGQVANFSTVSDMAPGDIRNALNSLLDSDVRIIKAEEVPLDFNARYDASRRVYRYEITCRPTSVWRRYRWYVKWFLDTGAMRKAAEHLIGEHDFSAFTYKDETRSPYIELSEVTIAEIEPAGIGVTFAADRFLRRMVRTLVGTLVEVGRHKMPPEEVRDALTSCDRTRSGPCAPPHGLFLIRVEY